jgi:hypothetical protein
MKFDMDFEMTMRLVFGDRAKFIAAQASVVSRLVV